nr:isoform 2 of elav-like protein 2 [Quercus suber]
MRNLTTGISKGFGFVKFENQSDAATAMAHFNGYRMDGHMLSVKITGMYEKVKNPIDVRCDKCGRYNHPTETCRVIAMSPQSNSRQGSVSNLGSTTKTHDRPSKEIDKSNLYVCYLPGNVDDNRLMELFSALGKITKARVMRNQTTGISKGFGFVKFENQSDAAAAMTHFNGYKMDGHMLSVKTAGIYEKVQNPIDVHCDKGSSYNHPKETCQVITMSPQSSLGQDSVSSLGSTTKAQDRPNKVIDNTNLYVCYLPENVDDNRLIELFSLFGKITKARVMKNRITGISKGFVFVKFENQIDAAAAIAHLNGYRMDGHVLAVRIAGAAPESLLPSHLSAYRRPPPVFPIDTGQIASLGWTPGSILSMPLTPFPISHGMNFLSSSIYEEHGNVLRSEGLDFAPPPGLSSLSDLPGCSSLHSSSNSSNQIQSTSGGLIAQFPVSQAFTWCIECDELCLIFNSLLKCSNWSLLKGTGQLGQHEGMQWFRNSCQQFIATIFDNVNGGAGEVLVQSSSEADLEIYLLVTNHGNIQEGMKGANGANWLRRAGDHKTKITVKC